MTPSLSSLESPLSVATPILGCGAWRRSPGVPKDRPLRTSLPVSISSSSQAGQDHGTSVDTCPWVRKESTVALQPTLGPGPAWRLPCMGLCSGLMGTGTPETPGQRPPLWESEFQDEVSSPWRG